MSLCFMMEKDHFNPLVPDVPIGTFSEHQALEG